MELITIEAYRYEELGECEREVAMEEIKGRYENDEYEDVEKNVKSRISEFCRVVGLEEVEVDFRDREGFIVLIGGYDLKEGETAEENVRKNIGEHVLQEDDTKGILEAIEDLRDLDLDSWHYVSLSEEIVDDLEWLIARKFYAHWEAELDNIGTDDWAKSVSFYHGLCFSRHGKVITTYRS